MSISIVYWIVLFSILVLGYIAQTNPKSTISSCGFIRTRPDPVLAFVLGAILVLVAGFRYGVGTDFFAYYRTRVTSWQTVWEALVQFHEPGIRLLSKICNDILNDGGTLIFLSAAITVGLYCYVIYQHSPLYLVSMLIFVFLGDWQGTFNGVRQYLAAAILFAGHQLILKRKFIPYLLTVFLASLFHTTALVMIFPYFILTKKADISQLVLMIAGSLIIRFSYDLIFDAIGAYKGTIMNMQDEYMTRDINPLRIATCFIPVVIYYTATDHSMLSNEQQFYMNGLLLNAFAMLASMGSAYLGRIGIYTNAMVSIGYANLFLMIPSGKDKKTIVIATLGLLFVYWVYSLQGIGNFRWVFNR